MRSIVILLMFFSPLSFSHAPFQVSGTLSLGAEKSVLELLLTNDTASKICLLHLPYGSKLDHEELNKSNAEIRACITKIYTLKNGSHEIAPRIKQITLIDDYDLTAILEYDTGNPKHIAIEAAHLNSIEGMFITSSSFVVKKGDAILANKLFTQQDLLLDLTAPPEAGMPSFIAFFYLGLEHIVIGFDHLLFLAGLLLTCRRWSTTAAIITSFTMAHSATLAMAALGWVTVNSQWIETLIAASVVLVGLDNLWRGEANQEPKGRWIITFIFGLVHGFGFAGVLSESGLTSGSELVVSLLGFNLGVELGQLFLASVFLIAMFQLLKLKLFRRWGPKSLSLLVIAGGLFWLIERV